MNITKIELEKFKRVNSAQIDLSDINVLIGSNNAGKSSVLQGIHFSTVAAVAAKRLGKKTFTQDNLLYCPTRNFVTLRFNGEYQNQSNFSYLRVRAEIDKDGEGIPEEDVYQIRVYRGRNEGNVGCDRTGNLTIGNKVTDHIPPFSVYVPGLAGIPQVEEYRSESVVRKGVASGDANLYLRNVIYLIKKQRVIKRARTIDENGISTFFS
ncbi:AAA family ATPase [Vibrio cholerae]